jgi:putative transcriptional regulator
VEGPLSLRGKLLIAAPQLQDYFRRTVLLVLEHGEDGAMGLVLNRPTETEVAEAVPQLAGLADPGEVIHAGGPVQPDSVLALGDYEELSAGTTPVLGNVALIDPEESDPPLSRLRVYAGYAGWGPGQLDSEMEEGAWVTEDAHPDDPFAGDELWSEVLQRKGGGYALWTTLPLDPSLN